MLLQDVFADDVTRAIAPVIYFHEQDGARYIYRPMIAKRVASRSAMRRLVATFFEGSVSHAAAALIDDADGLSEAELDALQRMIDQARQGGEA